MKIEETKQLLHGIYRLHWREGGGSSLAVVGSMQSGARWFACADWTGKDMRPEHLTRGEEVVEI